MFKYDHKQDPLVPEPEILEGPAPKEKISPDDVTDFPKQRVVDMPEEFHYAEGKYRPPTLPYRSGFVPFNTYLEAGKVYRWCSCGATWNEPWCDHKCHYNMTRLRPVVFNTNKSGYYKLCNCKQSANAPFCNGTHKALAANFTRSYYGKWRMAGGAGIFLFIGFAWWNYYS